CFPSACPPSRLLTQTSLTNPFMRGGAEERGFGKAHVLRWVNYDYVAFEQHCRLALFLPRAGPTSSALETESPAHRVGADLVRHSCSVRATLPALSAERRPRDRNQCSPASISCTSAGI